MKYRTILLITLIALFLSLPSSLFAQPEPEKTIEETYSSTFYIDKNGHAKHQVTVSFPPSSYGDYLKKNPEVLKNQIAGAMKSDYAIFGWKVKKVRAEIKGRGKDDILQIIASGEIENMAKKEGDSWRLNITYPNPQEAAKKLLTKWQTLQQAMTSFGAEKYRESGENVIFLPKGAEIINIVGLENKRKTSRINYGGGSSSETTLTLEEKEGKQAIVTQTTHIITTKNLTADPQKLAQEMYDSLLVEYAGNLKGEYNLSFLPKGILIIILIAPLVLFRKKLIRIFGYKKKLILVLFLAFAVVGVGIFLRSQKKETKRFFLPPIPGVQKVYEKEEKCSSETGYLYSIQNPDPQVAEKVKDSIKNALLMGGWKQEKEELLDNQWVLVFSKGAGNSLEMKVGPAEKGVSLIFSLVWPCQ